MTEPIVIQIVVQIGTTLVALIAAVASVVSARSSDSAFRSSRKVQSELQNTHSTNIRDDIDTVNNSILNLHDRLSHIIERLDSENARMWRKVNKIWDRLSEDDYDE